MSEVVFSTPASPVSLWKVKRHPPPHAGGASWLLASMKLGVVAAGPVLPFGPLAPRGPRLPRWLRARGVLPAGHATPGDATSGTWFALCIHILTTPLGPTNRFPAIA